ncbi:type VII secretion target [Paractinoplanes globisporus]|uniref:Type VII secretion target n=1 Tax=Paractinoplanes globisporus TaxID=113565 RepID=A0ABW6WET3_9ACTN|nr:type VII secretion target [Actinoplanes globisporus]
MSGSGDQMQVDSGELVVHAGQVDGIGDQLTTAQQAGSAVRVDSSAYGQLCQFVPALLSILQDRMIEGIAAAASSAHDTANALRSVAADYAGSDSRAAERIRSTR